MEDAKMKQKQYIKPEAMLVEMDEQLMRKGSWRVTNPDGTSEQRPIGEADGDEIEVMSKKSIFWDDDAE